MKTISLLFLLLAVGCAHVTQSVGTFTRHSGDAGQTLTLKIARHMDQILHGPDIEEDQILLLEVRNPVLNQKILLPDPRVKASYAATRFGPTSRGDSFKGYLMVTGITDTEVLAKMNLTLIARTPRDSYVTTEQFHGDFTFLRGVSHD